MITTCIPRSAAWVAALSLCASAAALAQRVDNFMLLDLLG
jgi:hypothetical protein